jgi:iron complex outermembrane recepter protein
MKPFLMTWTCVASLLTFAGAAQAQSAAPVAPSAQESVGLGDIIVTAQRRSENLQKAGIAVTAIKPEELISAGVTTPQQLTKVVPALQVANAAGPYALFYLRGVGNFNGNSLSDSAVAVNLDGVVLARPSSTSGLFYDLERVEVLKGPQGTLYGRNATGGAINIITRKPQLGVFGGDLSASYGNYDALQLNGAVNLPIGDNAAMRAAGQYLRHDGYMSDGTSDQQDASARLQFRWEPSASTTVQLGADYFDQGGRGTGSTVLTDAVSDLRVGLGDSRSDPAFSSVYFFPAGNTYVPVANDTYLDNQFWGGYASVDQRFDFATLTAIAGYRGANVDFRSNSPSFLINQKEGDDQYSVEVRLASNGEGPIQWLAGGYYFKENIDVPSVSYNQQVSGSFQTFATNTTSGAVFGRVTASLADTFRLVAGARYTKDQKDFSGDFYQLSVLCGGTVLRPANTVPVNCFGAPLLPNTVIPGPIFAPNGALIPYQPFGAGAAFPGGPATTPSFLSASQFSVDRSSDFERLTWRAGFEWDALKKSLVYGSYETGFKSGGFFFTRDDPTYRPETIKAWTLGMKNRFVDDRLQLNIEGFWWNYRDQQVSSAARDSFGNIIFATRNVGRSTNRGVEVEAVALVTPRTRISANAQYLDALYDSFVYTTPNNSPQVPGQLTSVPPTANCPFVLGTPTTVYLQDCSNRRPANAPKWVFSLGGEHTIPLGEWNLVLNASTRYQSEVFNGLEYLSSEVQKGYWQSDASVTLSQAEDRYFVTAFVNNIENNDVVSNSFPNPFGGAALVVGAVRPPRLYGIRTGLKF